MQQVLPEASGLHEIVTNGTDSLAAFEVDDFGQ